MSAIFTKHFFAYLDYIFKLIINTSENKTIIRQHIFRNFHARINHIQPVGYESAVALCVLNKAVAIFVQFAAHFIPFVGADAVFIVIDEVVTSVVVRVYKDAVFDTNRKSLLRRT